ncbi:MAG: hypothetical protein IJX56_00420 [Alistipes sp.]|nr:hypothetical protein [Alistipes sp.]
MIKKLFSLMACAALVFGMAACSDSEDPAPNKGGNNSEQPEVPGGTDEELFPEGYYLTFTMFDEEGYPTEDGQCVMYLEQNSEDENAYALYYPLNYPILLLAEVGNGTIDPKKDELVFDGTYLYYDENEELVSSEYSLFDEIRDFWTYEDMVAEMGFTQAQIEETFLPVWPDSDGIMFYIAPFNYSQTETGMPMLPATEFRICNYFIEDFNHNELVFVNNLGYCYQGAKVLSETELQPIGDTFYDLQGMYSGMMMYELVENGEELDLAERYYAASAQALTRGMMLKKNLVEKNTFTPSQYKMVR